MAKPLVLGAIALSCNPLIVPVNAARTPSELATAVVFVCVVMKPDDESCADFMRANTGSSCSTRSSGVAPAVASK